MQVTESAEMELAAGTSSVLDPRTLELIGELQRDELARTGEWPETTAVVRTAIETLHARRLSESRRHELIEALLDFGRNLSASKVKGIPSFTNDEDANSLVITDGFAFLLGIIFDQGIRAERAWAAPYELKRRLGHLDPRRILLEPDAVAHAVQQPPMLHRFIEKIPQWIVAAARRVVDEYGGRAEAIWLGGVMAEELRRRFDAFDGIGQKKAAIAVEILERDLNVSVANLEGSDIAYDVHVRRVFLRTGLAVFDDPDHMVAVAREANAVRPGAVDFPAWTIGRTWCHAGVPDCPSCRLVDVCPKLIDRAGFVRGV
jgi:uncharacterized HhH-GPD family protein